MMQLQKPDFGATVCEPVNRYTVDKISPFHVSAGIPLGEAFNDLSTMLSFIKAAADVIALAIEHEEVRSDAVWSLVWQLDAAHAFVQSEPPRFSWSPLGLSQTGMICCSRLR